MSEFGPTIKVTQLVEKTSKKGNKFFAGRLGQARIVLLKAKEPNENGEVVWDLVISEWKGDAEAKRHSQRPLPESRGVGDEGAPF